MPTLVDLLSEAIATCFVSRHLLLVCPASVRIVTAESVHSLLWHFQVFKGYLIRESKFVALKKINILQKVGGWQVTHSDSYSVIAWCWRHAVLF